MHYLPHTHQDISSMLARLGLRDLNELFQYIPKHFLREEEMKIPPPLSEWELMCHIKALSSEMGVPPQCQVYVGAGIYEHFIPAIIPYILSRSEFLTSYTPYQPEISQGTLQAIYEYQTLTCRLLGMEVANASLYDGASALAEAILMAIRVKGIKKVALSGAIHPHYRQVVLTYLRPMGVETVELAFSEDGRTDSSQIQGLDEVAAVAVQSPNFFGCIEDLAKLARLTHGIGALFVVCFTEALAYGLLKNPGSLGADIVCGQGQSLGIPPSFGGAGLGMFATKMEFVRQMPGRLVGMTVDREKKRGFVLTLSTREQHIRREKATSNICTNSNLCALASAIYMATLGGGGMRRLASLNRDKAEYLKRGLMKLGAEIPFSSPTFNEFVVRFPYPFESKRGELMQKGMVAGVALQPYYPQLEEHYLFCVTETKTREQIDQLLRELES
jgi:glycine dehydrogenase subunit 1